MTQKETQKQLDKIALELMHLANVNNGNSRELDAILKAGIALQEERESR